MTNFTVILRKTNARSFSKTCLFQPWWVNSLFVALKIHSCRKFWIKWFVQFQCNSIKARDGFIRHKLKLRQEIGNCKIKKKYFHVLEKMQAKNERFEWIAWLLTIHSNLYTPFFALIVDVEFWIKKHKENKDKTKEKPKTVYPPLLIEAMPRC